MEFPQFLIPYLKIAHSLFNTCLFAAFLYQARLGWRIRKNRLSDDQPEALPIRRHRKLGPVITALLPLGFLAGLILTYMDQGNILKYPYHLLTGGMLVVAVVSTWLISKNIKGTRSDWRIVHSLIGIAILVLFLAQIFLGLNVLL